MKYEWVRQPYEPNKVYAAFMFYRDLSSARSLEAVSQKYSKSLPIVNRWSGRWNWLSRAKAYDEHLKALAEAERKKASMEIEKGWAERREALRQGEWKLAEALLAKAERMLRFPVEQVEVAGKDGNPATVIKPARWHVGDIPNIVAMADKLQRLASEMETSRQKIEAAVEGGATVVEDLEAIRRRRWEDTVLPGLRVLMQQGQSATAADGHDDYGSEGNEP